MSALFTPLQIGRMRLSHRIVMAPLTRFRNDAMSVPHEVAAEYYEQRTTAGGLIITEATVISEEARGEIHVPGIWSDDQIAGWKVVTDRVHAKGGFIYLQLWSFGRAAIPEVIRSFGHKYVAPSAIPMNEGGEVPEPLTKEDIYRYVKAYGKAANNAIAAGFDGVELHSCNGFLLDQFLQTSSNHRDDEFGGSDENRARFLMLVAKEITEAIGEDRVGVRISPYNPWQGMGTADPIATFSYVTKELRDRFPLLAYLHVIEGRVAGFGDRAAPASENSDFARTIWNAKGERAFISAGGYSKDVDLAEKTVEEHGGAVVFGRAFVSNPDLVYRVKNKLQFAAYDRSLFFRGLGPTARHGYVDYPAFGEEVQVAA